MTPESSILKRVQLRASELGWRLLRNNVGLAWTGKPVPVKGTPHVLLQHARRIKFGLAVGSSDLIGWREVTITPEMIGHKIAVFSAVEVKSKTGRPTAAQLSFIDAVRTAGGYARIVRSEEEV